MSDETIEIRGYLDVLLRRWWLILLGTLLALLAAFAFSLWSHSVKVLPTDTIYQASSIVHLEGVEGLAWIPELAESRPVLEDVIDDLDLSLSIRDLRSGVTASQIGSSSLVRITVEDSNPEMAISLANGIAESYTDYILVTKGSPFLVPTREGLSESDANSSNRLIAQVLSDLGSLRPYVISLAETPDVANGGAVVAEPASNTSRNFLLAGFLGVALSVVLIIGGEYIQNPVRSPAQFDRKFTLTRLGTLPRWSKRKNRSYSLPVSDGSTPAVAEAIRQLATGVAGVMGEPGIRTLAIVSPASKDGRRLEERSFGGCRLEVSVIGSLL